jgi:hypothetical protein
MPEQPSPKALRRQLRISLRGLMVVVLITGCGLAWVIHRAQVQRNAVAAITRVGGHIGYSWQRSNGALVSPISKPPWPDWVRRRLGPDFLDTVTYVYLRGEQCDDEAFRAVCRLPWLEELTVANTSVTDASAEHIRQLTNLKFLVLSTNRITSRPLRHIGAMRELRELQLFMKRSPVPLRDKDMEFLRRLTNLERLTLASADLTDGWLVCIKGLTSLRSLQLYDMAITPEGLDPLKSLPNVTAVLTLRNTQIPLRAPNDNDDGIAEAKRHPLLRLNRKM